MRSREGKDVLLGSPKQISRPVKIICRPAYTDDRLNIHSVVKPLREAPKRSKTTEFKTLNSHVMLNLHAPNAESATGAPFRALSKASCMDAWLIKYL